MFQNLTPDYENSDFFSEKNALGFLFWPKFSKTDFFCPKKDVLLLLGGIHHLAMLFYGLNLRDSHQTSGIWCEIAISGIPSQLDWPRSKKTGKIRKQCYQTLFLGLTAFNTQNKAKLQSDQVSRQSINKKYDFGQFFDFSWLHQKMAINFSKNQKVAFLCKKTGSNGFPVSN